MQRYCEICKTPLHACMGFVNAEDFLNLLTQSSTKVRELCGHCVLQLDLNFEAFIQLRKKERET